MFGLADDKMVALALVGVSHTLDRQVGRLRAVGGEDDVFGRVGVDERGVLRAGRHGLHRLEARLAADYEALGSKRSLRFNLAYAEGFESMALAIGHMLIEDRDHLFGGAEPAVASLVLWHFVEEIEHKTVTFDVFEHLYGGYLWRIIGLIVATVHIMARTRSGYKRLLQEDGLWHDLRSRLALAGMLLRIFGNLGPRLLRIMRPGYNPRQVADPQWMHDWAALHDAGAAGVAQIDTTRLAEAQPMALAA